MSTIAATAKQEVELLLRQLPDDATLEDIQYHLYVLEKVKRDHADVAAGRSYSTEGARERLGRPRSQQHSKKLSPRQRS